MKAAFLVLATLLALNSCGGAAVPFASPALAPTNGQTTAAGLVADSWANGRGGYFIRQSALFEFGDARLPMAGFMRLDLDAGAARLVGLNDLGFKLFDVEVFADREQGHFLLPELEKIPDFAGRIAASVRRVFLAPLPGAADPLHRDADSYRLTQNNGARRTEFIFGGAPPRLLAKESADDKDDWRVRYYEYQRGADGGFFPGGVVLDDRCTGTRLTLWLLEVTKTDE